MSDCYKSPLASRYSSKYMQYLYSDQYKFETWRKLWVILAKSECELGLAQVKPEDVDELAKNVSNIDFKLAAEEEKLRRHDVMAHVHTFKACVSETAGGIIHLGATSCFVGDNTELIIHKKALSYILDNLAVCIYKLKNFCEEYKSLPCLGYTHLQPAQLTTVGKRATLWLQDFITDFHEISNLLNHRLKFRSIKGATGTQASFLELFNNDHEKVKQLDALVTKYSGFETAGRFISTGQTYPRKLDGMILNALAGLGQSAYKMCQDLRILSSWKEIEEPFEKNQIGSSAMPYKRNPMRSERCCALARQLMSLNAGGNQMAATQMFERTLDDSAFRRLALPEAALLTDSILKILNNVTDGLVVYPKVIDKRVNEELPFMVSENIMMHLVKNHGQNRQEVHEKLRVLSQEAGNNVKVHGLSNNLIELILADSYFSQFLTQEFIDSKIMRAEDYIGRSRELVEEFIVEEVNPVLEPYLNQKNQPDVAVSFIDTLVEEKYSSRVDFQETVKLTI